MLQLRMDRILASHFVLLLIAVACKGECPVWTTYNSTTQHCQCGSKIDDVIICDSDSLKVSLSQCYCITYNEDINTTVVGTCVITCLSKRFYKTTFKKTYIDQLNKKMCGSFKRTGQLCGKCVDNYSLPVYSYSQECIRCSRSDFKHNLLKYVCIAFLPLTVFYFFVVLFKITVTSGNLVGYVMLCQIVSSPLVIRSVLANPSTQNLWSKIVIACFEIWNLDFFRSLYSPFCIHPEMTAMQVLALDYLVAVYPLLLIFLTYIAVSLHDRYPIVVKMWRPAYRVFRCIRREWNVRGSLVQAFASFLVLSYVKFLNASFDLLRFVQLKNPKGKVLNQTYLYSNAEIAYFGPEHLPYGVLAIAMLIIFNLLPMILLLLYPCRCFQRCLNRCGVRSQLLHTFMDAFQGCYRHQPRDCRYFAGIYFCIRIVLLLTMSGVKNRTVLMIFGSYFTILALILLIIEPYKIKAHCKIDISFLLLISIVFSSLTPVRSDPIIKYFITTFSFVLPPLFLLYGGVVIIHRIIPERVITSIKTCWQCIQCKKYAVTNEASFINNFDNITDENSRLLN